MEQNEEPMVIAVDREIGLPFQVGDDGKRQSYTIIE